METTWLDSLQRELGDVDPESIKGPSEEQSSHEQFVGYAPESLRKLYALSRRHARTAAEIMVQAQFEGDDALSEQYAERIAALKAKSDLLIEIFWVALKDEFHLWNKSIGIRKEWRVVWFSPQEPDLGEILSRIFDQ